MCLCLIITVSGVVENVQQRKPRRQCYTNLSPNQSKKCVYEQCDSECLKKKYQGGGLCDPSTGCLCVHFCS